ncbi:MAG: hypothetical protein KBA26_03030 [Candidatus Delongbacteria bacterium]|nr:hypothetical protein [Candidatus Delongbacteria bacterium]
MNRLEFILMIGVFLFSGSLIADSLSIPCDNFSIRQGMSHNDVLSIFQDSRGFLWIGTEEGLNRYDGYSFKVFTHQKNDTNSLPGNYVSSICEDGKGRLWVLSSTIGLSRYHPEQESFDRFRPHPDDTAGFSIQTINQITWLSSARDLIWISTNGQGMYHLNTETGRIRRCWHNPDSAGQLSNYMMPVYQTQSGSIWIGSANGLIRYSPELVRSEVYNPDPHSKVFSDNVIREIYETPGMEGILWLGTSSGGLLRFDMRDHSFKRYRHRSHDPYSLPHNRVQSILACPDDPKCLIIGTNGGLCRFDPVKETFTPCVFQYLDKKTRHSNMVTRIYQDHSGIYWFGVTWDGLNKLNSNHRFIHFHRIRDPQNEFYGSFANYVSTFWEDDAGKLWIGTGGCGVYRYDTHSGESEPLVIPFQTRDLYDMLINDIFASPDSQNVWIVTPRNVTRYNRPTRKFRQYPGLTPSVSHGTMYAGLHDSSNRLWIAGMMGLNRLDTVNGKWNHIPYHRKSHQIEQDSSAFFVMEDQRGRIWVGAEMGLFRLEESSQTLQPYSSPPGSPIRLDSSMVIIVVQDQGPGLWVGTHLGPVHLINPDDSSKTEYCPIDPQMGNFEIRGICLDEQGYVWMNTKTDLMRYDPLNKTILSLDASSGQVIEEFLLQTCLKSEDGRIWMGGANGFISFLPSDIKRNQHAPIVMTQLYIDGKPVAVGQQPFLPVTLNELSDLVLPYSLRDFSLEMACLDFSYPLKNQFAWKLEQSDQDWNYAGYSNRIDFLDLSPGRYKLLIKAANSTGTWNEKPRVFLFTIRRPFWNSWLFYLTICMVLSLASFSGFRIYKYYYRLKISIDQPDLEHFFNHFSITQREQEILLLVMQGKTNQEIENELFISLKTVKTHLYNVFRKLKVNNRLQLINCIKEYPYRHNGQSQY